MTVDLSGRVVLVTVGAGGIGRALVSAFSQAGARVAVASREPSGGDLAVECDVREAAQC